MILFDGVSLESIAPVMIEDIRVSPVSINAVSRPRAIGAGSVYVRTRYATRTVSVTFAVIQDDREARQNALDAITIWAKSDKAYRLDLPMYADRHLMAVCTQRPEPSYRQWWESKLRVTFECVDDPFWISNAERTAACGDEFFAGGDAPPLMRIENTFSATATNQQYSDGENIIEFSSIGAGDFVIDINKQTATLDGVSVMSAYQAMATITVETEGVQEEIQVPAHFLQARTGKQTITGAGTVHFWERWQ